MKKELIEFYDWYVDNFEVDDRWSTNEVVEFYLNSIDSPQHETSKVITNEDNGNLCDVCGTNPTFSYDIHLKLYLCKQCRG